MLGGGRHWITYQVFLRTSRWLGMANDIIYSVLQSECLSHNDKQLIQFIGLSDETFGGTANMQR